MQRPIPCAAPELTRLVSLRRGGATCDSQDQHAWGDQRFMPRRGAGPSAVHVVYAELRHSDRRPREHGRAVAPRAQPGGGGHIKRTEAAGRTAVAVTVDRNGRRNQQPGLPATDRRPRLLVRPRPRQSPGGSGPQAMDSGVDLSGLRNIPPSAMTWGRSRPPARCREDEGGQT